MDLTSLLTLDRSKLVFTTKLLKKYILKLLRQVLNKLWWVSKTQMRILIYLKISFIKWKKTKDRD